MRKLRQREMSNMPGITELVPSRAGFRDKQSDSRDHTKPHNRVQWGWRSRMIWFSPMVSTLVLFFWNIKFFQNFFLLIFMSLFRRCRNHIPVSSVGQFSSWLTQVRLPWCCVPRTFGYREHICLTRFQPATRQGWSPPSPLTSVGRSKCPFPAVGGASPCLSSDLGSQTQASPGSFPLGELTQCLGKLGKQTCSFTSVVLKFCMHRVT